MSAKRSERTTSSGSFAESRYAHNDLRKPPQLDLGEYHIHKIANRSAGIVARSFGVSAEM